MFLSHMSISWNNSRPESSPNTMPYASGQEPREPSAFVGHVPSLYIASKILCSDAQLSWLLDCMDRENTNRGGRTERRERRAHHGNQPCSKFIRSEKTDSGHLDKTENA